MMKARAFARLGDTLSAEDYRVFALAALSERAWRQQARAMAALRGFDLQYHTFDSRRSDPGWPDDVFGRESDGRLLFFEFKRLGGVLTVRQSHWLDFLWTHGHEAACWWPDEVARLSWWLDHPHPVRQSCLETDAWRALPPHPTPLGS